jgi:DNA-binding Lrp family transcriptional regulator
MSPNLDAIDKELMKILQGDIPLTLRPYRDISEQVGITEDEVVERINGYIEKKYIRRFGATLRHQKAGFSANGMAVWKIPEEDRQRVGEIMAGFREVSHCYERPTFPDWPYNIFTMLHGKTEDECRDTARRISEATGITDYHILFSVQEFKKTSMVYFD